MTDGAFRSLKFTFGSLANNGIGFFFSSCPFVFFVDICIFYREAITCVDRARERIAHETELLAMAGHRPVDHRAGIVDLGTAASQHPDSHRSDHPKHDAMSDPAGGMPPPNLEYADPGAAAPPTMRRDLISAYAASAVRFGSILAISAMIYRFAGAGAFAMFALVRGTIGLLNYISLGLAPALVHKAAQAEPTRTVIPVETHSSGDVLEYQSFRRPVDPSFERVYANALIVSLFTAIVGIIVIVIYAIAFERLYDVPWPLQRVMWRVVLLFGVGTLLRLISDTPGAVLQVRGKITRDNRILAVGDLSWLLMAGLLCGLAFDPDVLIVVAAAHAISGAIIFLARLRSARKETDLFFESIWLLAQSEIIRSLLGYGVLVVAAQLADYLYAPTDYILIDRLLGPLDIANYAPAVQIDSGLLMLVIGLSAVLLPKAALAHAAGSSHTVRRYYIRGTLASFVMLAIASTIVWLIAPWILRLWLGNPMPGTQAILPLALIGTVLGGSSAVGRSILLAVGKVRPFAISVLIAGVVNAVCSYLFVRYLHLGLAGILWGTVVAVVGRCGLWMPWYVMRTLHSSNT